MTKPTDSLLLKGRVGSHAFGLAHEDSDEDFQGVFVEPTQNFLGLDAKIQESYSYKDPDTTYHEIGKFCRLALGCNPTILDLLWLDEYNVRTQLGTQLINLRTNFLSRSRIRNSYLGYALSQLGKLGKDPRPEKRAKNARHFLRLLNHGFNLYETGTYSVRLKDPESYVALGNRIGRDGDYAEAKAILSRYERWFDLTNSPLPESPNRQPIDAWLKGVRNEFYEYRHEDFAQGMEKFKVWP